MKALRLIGLTVVLLFMSACSTTPTPAPALETTAPATGKFYVVGKDIVGPDGNIFYPIGANAAIRFTSYPYVFDFNGGINDRLENVKAWNWNIIRANLICNEVTGNPSFDELVNGITATIDKFTAAKVVVILSCHDLIEGNQNPTLGNPKDLAVRRFWDTMTDRYKNNPYVWFNIYNEPYDSGDAAALAQWKRLHEFYVERVRSRGAENIIIADIPDYAQALNLLTTQTFADTLAQRCNVVFGFHAYGALGDFAAHEQTIRAVQAKKMAVIGGELGVPIPVGTDAQGPGSYVKNVRGFEAMRVLGPQYGIGLLWWHATGDSNASLNFALKNDRSGFWTANNSGNLTPFGQKFYNVSQRVSHSRGAFTGNLRDSNCASTNGGTTAKTLRPTEDRDNWAANSGSDTAINASRYQTAYLKFNLSSLTTVNSAILQLTRLNGGTSTVTVSVYEVNSDGWRETNNGSLPKIGKRIGSVQSSALGAVRLNVSSFIGAQKSGDGVATLAIRVNTNNWTSFGSSESTTPPRLIIR
jgi:mannan endo-1,4-beta-mannosidase